MTNGERLAFYRKKNAMTQQQLGERLNVSAQAVSKWENDQSEPDIATLCKLAEIYQISVNELVGAPAPKESAPKTEKNAPVSVILPVVVSKKKPQKKPSPVLTFLKRRWLLLLLVSIMAAALIVLGIVALKIWDAYEPERLLKKFENIEIGMTKDEVEDIMGEAEETFKTGNESVAFSEALILAEYGYENCEYWYYRDAKYDEMVDAAEEAAEDLDLGFEVEPWTQVRFVFNKEGHLIEAYYNASFKKGIWNDYGEGSKKVKELIFVDQTPYIESNGYLDINKADAKIVFEDGSIYLGLIELTGKAYMSGGGVLSPYYDKTQGQEFSYTHRWGTGKVYLNWK